MGLVDLSRILGKSTVQAKASPLGVTAAERGYSLCSSWVRPVLRESPGWGEFDEDSDLMPVTPVDWVEEGLNKGTVVSAITLVLELSLQTSP